MNTIVSLVNIAPANRATDAASQRPAPLSRHFKKAISEAKKNTAASPSTVLLPIHATLSTLEGCSPNSKAVSSASR